MNQAAMIELTETEILLEGDSTTTVETRVYVESIVLFTKEEVAEFTPMFQPMFAPDYSETLMIAPPEFTAFRAPILHDLKGNPTWIC